MLVFPPGNKHELPLRQVHVIAPFYSKMYHSATQQ